MIFLVAAEVPKKWHYLPCPPMSYTEVPGIEVTGETGERWDFDIFLTYFGYRFHLFFLQKRCSRIPKLAIFLDVFWVAWPIGVVRCYVFFCRTVPHHTYLKNNYFLVLSNVFWSSVLMRNPTMNCPQFFVLIWFLLAMPPIYTIWNDLKNAEWMVTWYWEG